MSYSALVTGCGDKRTVTALKTPPERLICEAAGARPSIPPEYQVDRSAASPWIEHDRYVASVRTREGIVAAYVLEIEGRLFVCSNNAQWRRDYEAGLPD